MNRTKDLIDKKQVDESINQSTKKDGSLSDDEAAWKIAEALGVRFDDCLKVVDTFGVPHALAALDDVQGQLAQGKSLRNPIGVMISKLRSGQIHVPVEHESDPNLEVQRLRIHMVLSDPTMDCPQKQIARRPLPPEFAHLQTGEPMVKCPCGCHREFPSAVSDEPYGSG